MSKSDYERAYREAFEKVIKSSDYPDDERAQLKTLLRNAQLQIQDVIEIHQSMLIAHQTTDAIVMRRVADLCAEQISALQQTPPARSDAGDAGFLQGFQSFLDTSNLITYVKDLNGAYTHVNAPFLALLSRSFSEIIGKRDDELFPPETAQILRMNDRSIIETNRVVQFTETVSTGGHLRQYLSMKFPIHSRHGEVVGTGGISSDISEIIEVESNQQYRALFERSHDAVFLIALDGRLINFNQSAIDLLGYSRDELLGKHLKDVHPLEEQSAYPTVMNLLLNGEDVPIYERTFLRKDGTRLICELSVALVRDENGYPLHFQTIAHDVTRTKELVASLEESRYFIEQVAQTIPDMIYVFDIDSGEMIYHNRSLDSTLGYQGASHSRDDLAKIIHPDDLAKGLLSSDRFQALNSENPVLHTEFRIRHANGYWEWVYLRELAFRRNADGQVKQVICLAQKFTKRKELENVLQLNQRAIDVSTVGISVSDVTLPDMPLVFVNSAFCTLTGYTPDEVLGKNCRILQGEDTQQSAIEEIRAAFHEARDCKVTLRNYRKDGSLFWNELRLSPIFDESGKLVHYVGIQTDVTDSIESQQKLEEALHLAQDASQLKNRFISIASHEFRTPLAVIRSSAETLRDYYERMDKEQRQRRFHNIDVQVSRISSMLDDVLTLGKLENPQMVVNLEEFEFEEWVRKFLEEFKIAHQSFYISLHISGSIYVAADRILLRQILSNLLSNAIKYSGSSNLVELKVDKDREQLRLVVKDYGIGIPGDDLPELFKEFQRASNVGTIQGTGLGLVIVQRAVKLHDGHIAIDSELGKGTVITIHLPVILKNV